MAPAASIIILTYNNLEYTRQCLESIYAETDGPEFEVIAVDNASQDETPQFLQDCERRYSNFRSLLNPVNLGFARGNNRGAAQAQGEHLVFLNNDTVVTSGWLAALLRHLQEPRVGMVGPVTNHIGNESLIQVNYSNLDEMRLFAGEYTRRHAGQAFEVPMLALFCAAIRREVFEAVGPLDERFGTGMFEDDDYAERLHAAGYVCLCAEDAFVHHWGSAGFSWVGFQRYWRTFTENREKFEQKWGREWIPTRYRAELLDRQLGELVKEKTSLAFLVIERDQKIAALEAANRALQGRLDETATELMRIHYSRTWKVMQAVWRAQAALFPPGSGRERLGSAAFQRLRGVVHGLRGRRERQAADRKKRDLTGRLQDILSQHPGVRETVLFLPTVQWDLTLFQRPHQLALAFARQDCLVFFCDPTSPEGFQQVEERLYTANLPLEIFNGLPDPIIFTLVYNKRYLETMKTGRVVYEHIDELEVFPGDLDELRCSHVELTRSADLVIATAERLYREIQPERPDVLLNPNGVDLRFIQETIAGAPEPPEELRLLVERGRPIIGYYGALARWFDFDLLVRAAVERPGYQFVLIGPDYDGSVKESQVAAMENIAWLGPKPYRELPRYLKYFDVATIPFKLNKITHSTSPLKLFEYMSARKPVVTTAMHESARYPVVLVGESEMDFIEKLDLALQRLEDQDFLEALESVARENTWDTRAEEILKALEKK
jgi:GT2 family glycosyltransferase/glycosyltransferase involved in cell wall biosynthesis